MWPCRYPARLADDNSVHAITPSRRCQHSMATYSVIPKTNQTFRVAIVGDDGARQTLLGFETQADGEAWIAQDRRQSQSTSRGCRAIFGRRRKPDPNQAFRLPRGAGTKLIDDTAGGQMGWTQERSRHRPPFGDCAPKTSLRRHFLTPPRPTMSIVDRGVAASAITVSLDSTLQGRVSGTAKIRVGGPHVHRRYGASGMHSMGSASPATPS